MPSYKIQSGIVDTPPLLYIIGGLPQTGKTTAIKGSGCKLYHIHRELYSDDPLETWQMMVVALEDAILNKRSVIFDSCGTNFEQLERLVCLAVSANYITAYIYLSSPPLNVVKREVLNKYRKQLVIALPQFQRIVKYFKIVPHTIALRSLFMSRIQHATIQESPSTHFAVKR